MPGDPKECRQQAKCCLELAAAASMPMVQGTIFSGWLKRGVALHAS